MPRIAIIGAGASGLMAAITAAKNGTVVDLYEHNDKPAKEILASGNGRCNIINTSFNHNDYSSQNPTFVNFALDTFDFKKFEHFVHSIGLLLDIKADGRCYPLSNEAKSVAIALENAASIAGMFLTTECVIVEEKSDTPEMPPMGGGMPGMGGGMPGMM